MLIFFVSLFCICISVTVSEQQPLVNLAGYGSVIDNVEGSLYKPRFNAKRQRFPEYDEPIEGPVQQIGEKPCSDRRSMYDSLGYPDAPVAPDSISQMKPVIFDKSEQTRKPEKKLEAAPSKINLRVPPSSYKIQPSDKDANKVIAEKSATVQPFLPLKTINQLPNQPFKNKFDNKDTEIILNTEPDPKELPEHILKHNEDIPLGYGSFYSHSHLPVTNKPVSTVSTNAPDSKDSPFSEIIARPIYVFETIEPVTAKSTTQKPKLELDIPVLQTNCDNKHNAKEQNESIDSLQQSRRSFSQGDDLGPVITNSSVLDSKSNETHYNLTNDLKQNMPSKEIGDDNNRYGFTPGSQYYYTPSSVPIQNINSVTPKSVLIREPSIEIDPYQLMDPTKGVGISSLTDSQVVMMESSRICYACSTLSDPSCWFPNRGTTVKYCRQGHNRCVTKTYKSNPATLIVIRDCSDGCFVNTPGLVHYDSCSVCKDDLCNNLPVENGAFSSHPFTFLSILIVTGILKFAF